MQNATRTEQNSFETPEDVLRLPQPKKNDLMDDIISEICGDRRTRRRYEIDLVVQFKVFKNYQIIQTGKGKTINLSAAGIACQLDEILKPGSAIELAIAWPVLLNKTCPLKLVVSGKVVRSDAALTAVRMDRYEFRTQGTRSLQTMTAGASA
jgi:PilZ domain